MIARKTLANIGARRLRRVTELVTKFRVSSKSGSLDESTHLLTKLVTDLPDIKLGMVSDTCHDGR